MASEKRKNYRDLKCAWKLKTERRLRGELPATCYRVKLQICLAVIFMKSIKINQIKMIQLETFVFVSEKFFVSLSIKFMLKSSLALNF